MANSGSDGERIELLEEQVARLCRVIERQQTELTELRGSRASREARVSRSHRSGRASSRRALLKWGTAAAAAASLALVASEQSAHASPAAGTARMADGDAIKAGLITTATLPTDLKAVGGATPGYMLLVDASPASGDNDGVHVFASGNGNGVYASSPAGTSVTGQSGTGTGVFGTSGGGGFGVHGDSSSNVGVYGVSNTSVGVWGESSLQSGVLAFTHDLTNGYPAIQATNFGVGNGIDATGADGALGAYGTAAGATAAGVSWYSDSGYGVVGASSTGIALFADLSGRLKQNLQVAIGAPTSGAFNAGEQIRDTNGDLYICIADGSPGVWKKMAAIPAGKPGGAIVFLPKPFRLFDTRPGVAGCPIDPTTPMSFPQVITLQVTGTPSTIDSTLVVPSGATGIVGDLLAINVVGNGVTVPSSGFLTLQPHSVTPTGNSFLHYYPNTVQHNSVVIGLDGAGKLDVGNYNAKTNVGLDILGYIL
jgi:hypothetical protein